MRDGREEERQQEETARMLREVEHGGQVRQGDTIAFARDVLRFDLPDSDGADDIVLVIREDPDTGPHGQVSEGAIAMASWICAQYRQVFVSEAQRDQPPLRILELGSGCGLPGLVLAALGATVPSAASSLCGDMRARRDGFR
jgi:hypothetical protein